MRLGRTVASDENSRNKHPPRATSLSESVPDSKRTEDIGWGSHWRFTGKTPERSNLDRAGSEEDTARDDSLEVRSPRADTRRN